VLIVDLDRFRLINESLGAEVGRRVLVTIAERLGPGLRPGDTLARLGGDEFGVLLHDPGPPAEVAAIAQHMTEQLAEPLDIEGGWVSVTGSVGIAYAPPAASAEEVLTNAEVAMYRAKRLGGDRVELFDDELRHEADWWMAVQTALHQSLRAAEERLGDGRSAGPAVDGPAPLASGDPTLTVLYQPEFWIADGRLIGAEALSRLHAPTLGEVPPERFVAVAAAAPALAASLFAVVVDDACRQVSLWRQHQPDAWVAVNVTASQLVDGRLIPAASQALERHGLDASALCLEVSETDVMRDVERSVATLQQLDDLGIQIAIDDFGTGYSSLGYAKRLPVRWLKIDREFVAGLGIDPVDSAIVNAAVALGRALGLTVTAEGVQTATQLEALAAVGCDIAQGYLLGRPMPAASIAELFSGAVVAAPAGVEPTT
jgi:diguanylate cyclase (GGDEF)-like protein